MHWIYYFPICFGITIIIGYLGSLLMPGPLAPIEDTVYGQRASLESVFSTDGEKMESSESE